MKISRLSVLVCLVLCLAACRKETPEAEGPLLDNTFGMAVSFLGYMRPVDIQTRYDMGVRWVRRDIDWGGIERTRGVFDFTEYDRCVNAETNAGVNVLGLLVYGNLLYNSDSTVSGFTPPDTFAYFGNYVKQTVSHFKDRIHVWEIWNEPNGPTFWKPVPSPDEYGKLAVIAAKAIHEADPTAKVMLSGMVGNSDPIFFGQRPWGFSEDLLRLYPELTSLVDIYAIHPYTFLQHPGPEEPTTNSLNTGFIDMLRDYRRLLREAGAGDKPIWITEMGWHSAINAPIFRGVTEETQAAYLVRASVLAVSEGIEKVLTYTYSDGPGDLSESESHFGVVRYLADDPTGNTPHELKPVYFAYKTMTEQLLGKHFIRDQRNEWSLPASVYAFRFDEMVVAWTPYQQPYALRLKEKPSRVLDMNGQPVPVNSATVTLGQNPVYIYL